ncbi:MULTISPECIES: hypothetical protein [Kitasatospora]|uniref:Uncharacterized protein n=1 Tax=Kitasatospora setae (strain ATCC 33774 / DSM 43861 / JCM 3304 / KCC A-0304 / NBRC 14216 / KM-6054) TaxID=452652 RepID=E4NFS2_KITSK|nr:MULTISPECIES: hypothetical protein [Kitasatospora]BAJ30352.1 hypothetical protein KSE_45710 [Kitasatospora setae KM-6054]
MYAIRLELVAPSAGGGCAESAGAGPVRAALLRLPLAGARVCHVRVRERADGLAAVCFLTAPSLLAAEHALRAGTAALVGPDGPLGGWSVALCEADPWIALGRWQDRAHR